MTPMTQKMGAIKPAILYSEAFKIEVVRKLEKEGLTFHEVRRRYGIGGCATVQRWVCKYGNGTRGKVIRVEKPEEINELKRLQQKLRRLESALADAHVDLAIERAYTQMACNRAGIADVEEFKKKAAGKLDTKR